MLLLSPGARALGLLLQSPGWLVLVGAAVCLVGLATAVWLMLSAQRDPEDKTVDDGG